MLVESMVEVLGETTKRNCDGCHEVSAVISMHFYSEGFMDLCSDCALQLARKLLEDLCELLTKGGRHG